MSTKESAAVFAPKAAKPETKAAEGSESRLAPGRSALLGHRVSRDPMDQVLFLQRTIGNRAVLRLLARRDSARPGNARETDQEQEVVGENEQAETAPRGVSWDLSKIPLFPHERASPAQPSSFSLAATPTRGPIQAKLVIGRDTAVAASAPQIKRKCAACEEEAKTLQPECVGAPETTAGEAPAIVHEVLRAPGRPLDTAMRVFFEPRFSFDFGQVRVHTDEQAMRSASAVGASAYSVGQDIVFGQGAFATRLLAHELTHVVQQNCNSAAGAHLQRQDASNQPSEAEEAAGARLRALAARPNQAIGQWQKLQAPEQSFIVMTMAGRYGADFAQEFLNYAQGRKKPDPSTEVTNTATPQSLTARGFQYAGDPGGVPLWVHPSGHEVLLLSPGQKPPASPEEAPKDRAFRLCSDALMMAGPDGCNACCDKNITGTSDYDIESKKACKELCGVNPS